jgi:hypothetical protein
MNRTKNKLKIMIFLLLVISIFITGGLSVIAEEPKGEDPGGYIGEMPDFLVYGVYVQRIPLINQFRVQYYLYNLCEFCVEDMYDQIYIYDPIYQQEYQWGITHHHHWDAYGDDGLTGPFYTDWKPAPREGLLFACVYTDYTDLIEESNENNNLKVKLYDFDWIFN